MPSFKWGIIERITAIAFIAGVAGVVASLTAPTWLQEYLSHTWWGGYLFVGSIIILVLSLAAFVFDLARYFIRRWKTLSQLEAPSADGLTIPDLEIRFSSEPPYETTEITNGRGLSTARIGIKALRETFSNCLIYIEKIAPQPALPGGLPIQLSGNVPMLRPDDPESLIEIAAHWDHVNKYRFSAPLPWFDVHLTYVDDEPPRLIEVKITARTHAGEFIKTATFKIWVDDAKKIHLQRQ
jgi:hypothetical protein